MSRKLIACVICTLMLGIITSVYMDNENFALSQNNVQKLNLKLNLEDEFTKQSNNMKMHEEGLKKHFNIDSKDHIPSSMLKMNLNLKSIDAVSFPLLSGNGVLQVGTDTYPFAIKEQEFPNYVLKDGLIVFRGAITATIRTKQEESPIVFDIDYIPSTNSTFISTSIGVLSEQKGLAILRFGKPIISKDIFQQVEKIRIDRQNKEQESGELIK